MRVAVEGSGPPAIFLHNGGSDHRIWDRQVAHLRDRYTTYAFDMLGFGASDRPDQPYTLEGYYEMLRAFVTERRLVRPLLVGNCIGGSTVLEYGFRHPDEPSAAIVLNVCGGRPMIERTTGHRLKADPWRKNLYFALFWAARARPYHRRFIRNFFGANPGPNDPLYRHLHDLLLHERHSHSRWCLLRGLPSFDKFGQPFERPAKAPPTLLMWGEQNRILDVACGRDLAGWLRPDRFEVIDGTGHMAMHEQADVVNREIDTFLGSHGTP